MRQWMWGVALVAACGGAGPAAGTGEGEGRGETAVQRQAIEAVAAPAAPGGRTLLSRSLVTTSPSAKQEIVGVASDADESLVVAGTFEGTIALGETQITSAGGSDGFVAKLDAAGQPRFLLRLGGAGEDRAAAVTADRAGNITVVGSFVRSVELGGGVTLTSEFGAESDVFVVRFDPDGRPLWAHSIDGVDPETWFTVQFVSADREGHVVVSGRFSGTARLAGGIIDNRGGYGDYLVRLDPAGAFLWSAVTGNADDGIEQLTTDAAGNVVVGLVDGRATDATVERWSAGGELAFRRTFKPGRDWLASLGAMAADGAGQTFVSMDAAMLGRPDLGWVLVQFDAVGGIVATEPIVDLDPRRIAAHPEGGFLIAGAKSFGPGRPATFVARVRTLREPIWVRLFAGAGDLSAFAVTPGGNAVVGGRFEGLFDLGDGALTSVAGPDLFVGKLSN